MSKSFQHHALLARNWNPSHSRQNEQIEEFTTSTDMKRIHGPNREEADSSQAEIYPESECCLRETHDLESSNFEATRRSLVKMKRITPVHVMIPNGQFVKSDRIDIETIKWLSTSVVLKPR
jgi:hypothetical protein